MKNAIATALVSVGAVALFAVMFMLALGETLLRGRAVLDCGLDEDAT